ncbi:hypothetical protein NEOC84_000383|uniref:hypothetical protein n=1 Tax=Neochlamydia sp. AcF84 TaxID=2315858 RepID=UPI00140C004B|nr:hypothetical protein [Neochlamydia sp. AcF84]NGY94503.1 hypothetical protein [Neochlamydia sp. AcF84]
MPITKPGDGVIVGTSHRLEWMLPWWWAHFRQHNEHPVLFVDYGDMSLQAKNWCQQRGELIKLELTDTFMARKDQIDPMQACLWEKMQPQVWDLRFTWYKKPFALLLSPFKRSLWLDLDCQVRGSLQPLFEGCENEAGFAVAAEHALSQELNLHRKIITPGQIMYNAGVIAFAKHSKIIKDWAALAVEQNHLFCSDQQLMAHILNSHHGSFTALPAIYNWTADQKFSSDVVILHRWGDEGKRNIAKIMEILTREMNFNFSF